VREVVYKVDNSGFYDVLSVDPGKVDGSACREYISTGSTKAVPTYRLKEG
jgi:hypothetical protein